VSDGIVINGTVYPDELSAVALTHPNIPDDIKQLYRPNIEDRREDTTFTYEMPSRFEKQFGVSPHDFFFGYPRGAYTSNNLAQELGYNNIKKPDAIETLGFINQVENMNDPWKGGTSPTKPAEELKVMKDNTISRMPPEGSRKPAGEFKFMGGTGVPEDTSSAPEPSNGVAEALLPEGSFPVAASFNAKKDVEMLKGFYDTVKNAFALPGDVYSGKIDPMSDQGIERAFDLAGFMVFGPAPVAAKMADGTLGSFIGVKGMNAKQLRDLKEAQFLESKGIHPDKIFQDIGAFRGVDNRWRFELDDSKAKFKHGWYHEEPKPAYVPADASTPKLLEDQLSDLFKQEPFDPHAGKTATTLGEVLDHPDLYKAYPWLQDIPVIKDTSVQTAHWNPNTREIVIGSAEYNTKDVLLHEIQHAIQGEEGFAAGGSWGQAGKTYELKYAKDFKQQVENPLREIYNKIKDRGGDATKAELAEINRLLPIVNKWKEYVAAGDEKAYQKYLNLAGEIEARNVEARLHLTEKQRSGVHPRWTEDSDTPIVSIKPARTTPYGLQTEVK